MDTPIANASQASKDTSPSLTVYTYQPVGNPTLQPGETLSTGLFFGDASPTAWALASAYGKENSYALEITEQVRTVTETQAVHLQVTLKNSGNTAVTPLVRVLFAEV